MLALLANVIAWPLSFFLMRLIFRAISYPYPLRMGPLIFLQAGMISVILAIITVGVQTLRAASVNPVNALRYE
jgi:ABC-type antimicrobial peptide transport system permease subunit